MHEGVGTTIFQSQVAVHALEMAKYGFRIEVWTFETSPKHLAVSRRNLEKLDALGVVPVRLLKGVYVFLPFSDLINALILLFHLRLERAQFDLVHARTDYSASVYSYIARFARIPLIWDCRGDSYAETEQALANRSRIPSFVRNLILRAVERQERRAGAVCEAANFVSHRLRARKKRSLSGQPTFVIPCAVSSRYFFFDSGLRGEVRAALGYSHDDVVLVYSGAMSQYQSFHSYVQLLQRLAANGDTRLRLLVVTPDIERAAACLASRLPSHLYELRTATYGEMNGYLNAADFGMLLREKSPINDVASPTKFGEYCLAGLPVILDGNVEQTVEIAAVLGNGTSCVQLEEGARLQVVDEETRKAIAQRAMKFFARECLNTDYQQMYSAVAERIACESPNNRTAKGSATGAVTAAKTSKPSH